jgi:glutamine synthetase adenylyltransferase
VISEEALASYYETAAAAWEKVAFMKARPVAGDVGLGWRTIRAVHPMIYQASMDYAGVRRIKELKEKIGAAHGKAEAGSFNVKLDPGGIRDLEFLAQAMQLLHGGRIPQLRDRSTQRALVALGEVKLLAPESVAELLHAYHFLRRIENRACGWPGRWDSAARTRWRPSTPPSPRSASGCRPSRARPLSKSAPTPSWISSLVTSRGCWRCPPCAP